MKCSCCGREVSVNERYCNYCGGNNENYVENYKQEYRNYTNQNNNGYTTYTSTSYNNNQYYTGSRGKTGIHAYGDMWKRFSDFDGRSTRAEFWYAILFHIIFTYIALLAVFLFPIYALAALIPLLAVTVRRLLDTGRSGWHILLALIPLIGIIVLIVLLCDPSK